MTRAELVACVQRELDVGRRDAVAYVDALLAALGDGLVEAGRVKINRFGLLSVRKKPARTGRDPRTGAAMVLPEQHTVSFRAAASFKAQLNAACGAQAGQSPVAR